MNIPISINEETFIAIVELASLREVSVEDVITYILDKNALNELNLYYLTKSDLLETN